MSNRRLRRELRRDGIGWVSPATIPVTMLAIIFVIFSHGCRNGDPTLLQRGIANRLQQWQGQSEPEAANALFPLETESKLQMTLEDYVDAYELPGAVLAISSSQHQWMGATGQSNLTAKTDLLPTDRFRLGGLGEILIGVICLQLEMEDLLSLRDPITQWLPPEITEPLPDSDQITIRQLLNHTSAIPDLDRAAFRQAVLNDPTHEWQIEEIFTYMESPETAQSRGRYTASPLNYLLLELIIEQASGQSLAELVQSNIAKPLNLADTFVELNRSPPPVQGYQDLNADGQLEDVNQPLIHTGLGLRSRAIVSNAPDLLRLMRSLFFEEKLLPQPVREKMLTIVETRRGGYGLGIVNTMTRWGEVWGQTDTTIGFSATVVYLPVHDLIILSWTNRGDDTEMRLFELIDRGLTIVLGNTSRYPTGPTVQW
ncbi:MAG: beta-lactamase family protein [Elainella sp. Prado103]|nr:beta-lactamase family protein [Elainella sp. Prado103]